MPVRERSAVTCPTCDHAQVSVTDTRVRLSGAVRRRRECGRCGDRWTTVEIPVDQIYLGGERVSGDAEEMLEIIRQLPGSAQLTAAAFLRFLAAEARQRLQ